MAAIDKLKAALPAGPKGGKRPKLEQGHLDLIELLEARVERIDGELAVLYLNLRS